MQDKVKSFKLEIDRPEIQKRKKNRKFLGLLQLGRTLNGISFILESKTVFDKSESSLKRYNVNLFLFSCSAILEGATTGRKVANSFGKKDFAKKFLDFLESDEMKEFVEIAEFVRNKITYHCDCIVFEEALEKGQVQEVEIFADCSSVGSGLAYYPLSDQLAFLYLKIKYHELKKMDVSEDVDLKEIIALCSKCLVQFFQNLEKFLGDAFNDLMGPIDKVEEVFVPALRQ